MQRKQVTYTQDRSFSKAALGGIRTHDTLLSMGALYQLSYLCVNFEESYAPELPGQLCW